MEGFVLGLGIFTFNNDDFMAKKMIFKVRKWKKRSL
jgi:hypothetical protein